MTGFNLTKEIEDLAQLDLIVHNLSERFFLNYTIPWLHPNAMGFPIEAGSIAIDENETFICTHLGNARAFEYYTGFDEITKNGESKDYGHYRVYPIGEKTGRVKDAFKYYNS